MYLCLFSFNIAHKAVSNSFNQTDFLNFFVRFNPRTITSRGIKRVVKNTKKMSLFENLGEDANIELLFLEQQFIKDSFDKKVSLAVGAYRDHEGKPWVLPVVRAAEKALANDETLDKEYTPHLGEDPFPDIAVKLLLGEDNIAIKENRVVGCQSLSGTGAVRLGADFIFRYLKKRIFYYSDPTWYGHDIVFPFAGFEKGRPYRYWSATKRGLDFDGMLEDLKKAPEYAVIILHACAHNPTGSDPTQDQWKQIADVMKKRKLIPFFDCAYQGLASGDLDKDAWVVRYFIQEGMELFAAQTFAKNLGMYNERVGNLTIVTNKPSTVPSIKSRLGGIAEATYGCPPVHGSRVVTYIVKNSDLYSQWKENIKTMTSRILAMRKRLRQLLEDQVTPGDWSNITSQIGIFSYIGLTEAQATNMLEQYHIYMTKSGRMNMCGLNESNIQYIANALHDSVTNYK